MGEGLGVGVGGDLLASQAKPSGDQNKNRTQRIGGMTGRN